MRYEDPSRQEMWDWFHKHFMHTDKCDPWESGLSGYQYVCGGPYFPGDLLRKEFGDKYDRALIDEVITALEAEDSEWAKAAHY